MEDYSMLLLMPLIVLLAINFTIATDESYYNYTDTYGSTGKADHCYTDGLMYCELDDNTTIQVVEFKYEEN